MSTIPASIPWDFVSLIEVRKKQEDDFFVSVLRSIDYFKKNIRIRIPKKRLLFSIVHVKHEEDKTLSRYIEIFYKNKKVKIKFSEDGQINVYFYEREDKKSTFVKHNDMHYCIIDSTHVPQGIKKICLFF